MDTVYNNETTGPFIQTFKFIPSGILFALYQTEKTSTAMKNGVDTLEDILGDEVFRKYVNVLLTDRGSEFYNVIFLLSVHWMPKNKFFNQATPHTFLFMKVA